MERDAVKRASAQAGAAGVAGAAAARANGNVNVTPLGDWSAQAEDPRAWPHCPPERILQCTCP